LGFTQEVGIGKEYFEVLETRIQEQLKKAKTLLSGLPTEIATHVLSGNPGDEIVAFAKENRIEMIFIGSRGRRRLRSHLLGSVSDRVVHHANCNVWVVH
jgi:nucleotide-binding universal stress UspA family protein